MLTISVKNFGPIAEGSVDLKPLTIFVGPSNTGKSYMATAVYAVILAQSTFSSQLFGTRGGEDWDVPEAIFDSLRDWVQQEAKETRINDKLPISSLPNNVQAWLNRETATRLNDFQNQIAEILSDVHGGSSSFAHREDGAGRFRLTIHQDDPALDVACRVETGSVPFSSFDISQIELPKEMYGSYVLTMSGRDTARKVVADSWVNSLSRSLFSNLPSQVYYLPAGRSAIAQAHKVLSAAIIRQHTSIGTRQGFISTLPGIMTDFLAYMIGMDRRTGLGREDAPQRKAVKFIEGEVLHGKVDLDESSGLPFPEIVYLVESSDTSSLKFTLDQTSSMVSELAPLILYLKYQIQPGDLLILEEPESHLHPAAQRQLARGIVRLVNAGVRVLITTHSDIIISQINNLLALNQASPELITEGGFEPEDFVSEDQVGAYLFRHSQELGGSEVVRLEIDPDTGIDEDEFAAVFESIYDESIALQRDRN